jgi:tetratricopeptide (TPR) repeat protein
MARSVPFLSDLKDEKRVSTIQAVRRAWPVLLIVALIGVGAVTWPWLRFWLPHPALVRAWVDYLVRDLDISQWGPVAALLLIGAIELVWAWILGRKSGAAERQWKRLESAHAREVEALHHEISLLEEERQALRAGLELHEDLVREETVRLWMRFEELQQAGHIPRDLLVSLEVPDLAPELRSEWRQIISQLERLEVARHGTVRRGQSALQVQRHADDLLRLGSACYYLGQYERALTHYDRVHDVAPNRPEALVGHAVVNFALHRHPQALQDLDHALKLEESGRAYLYRAIVREQQGEGKRALEDYARALRLDSGLADGYYRRGLLHARMGDLEKALQDQNRVLELAPEHVGGYVARGAALAALGDFQAALLDLGRGCELAPEWHEAFFQRGRVRDDLGLYDQAEDDLNRALYLAPDFAPAFVARGNVYFARGEYSRAALDYGRAAESQPRNAKAHCARGVARAAMGEYRQAIEDYDQALAIEPGLALALANRGAACEKLGEHEQAVRDLDRAIALDPGLAVAYYNRGLAYGNHGEYDRASRDLNKAVELDPSLDNQEHAVPVLLPEEGAAPSAQGHRVGRGSDSV